MSGTFASYPIQGSGGGGGSGTVTSVALLDGSSTPIYVISGSPVTTTGTLTFTLSTQTANKIFASGASGGAAQPAFRALVAADLPTGNLTDVGTDGIVVTGGTGSVIGSGTSLAQHVADSTHNGYLSSTDWATFNSKQTALTLGNLTDAGTDGITVTGGTGAVVGSGTSLSQHVADSTHNGYLSSTDWSTFNSKGSGSVISVAFSGGTTGLTTSGGPITTSGTLTLSGTLVIANGGTGQTTASAAFSALSPITTTGDIIYSSSGTTNSRLAIGSTGNVLTVAGGVPAWAPPATSGTVTSVAVSGGTTGLTTSGGPITTSGIITLAGTLAIANGGTGQTTATAAFSALSPITTTGDLIYSSSGTTNSRLPIGGTGNVLTVVGGLPAWAAGGGGSGTVTSVSQTVPAFLSVSGSPVTTTGTLAISYSGTALPIANGGTAVTATPTSASASNFAAWDASVNLPANNFAPAYTTTAQAGGTTTLTVASTRLQYFTGSGGQTVVLPVTSTLPSLGFSFEIVNLGTGIITVQSSGGNQIGQTLRTLGTRQVYTCVLLTGTTAASWNGSNYIVAVNGGVSTSAVPAFTDASGYQLSNGSFLNNNPTSGVPLSSSIAVYNGQSLLNVQTLLQNYTTTATAAGTTTLTINSTQLQVFTGSTTQTIKLPSTGASGTGQGLYYEIWNTSTGALSIQTSTAVALQTMAANTWAKFSVNSTADNTAPRWSILYLPLSATISGTGNQVLQSTGTTASTWTFDNTGGTSASININYCATGSMVSLYFATPPTATTGTASITFKSNTAIPAAYRPATQQWQLVPVQITGVNQATSGMMSINTDGTFTLYVTALGGAWTTAQATSGFAEVNNITYYIG